MPNWSHDAADMIQAYRKACGDSLELLAEARASIRTGDADDAYELIGRVMPLLLTSLAQEEITCRFAVTYPDPVNLTQLEM